MSVCCVIVFSFSRIRAVYLYAPLQTCATTMLGKISCHSLVACSTLAYMPTAYLESRRGTFFYDADGTLSAMQTSEDVQPYTLDWSDWLDGDTISTSTWRSGGGVTTSGATSTTTTTTVTVRGTDGYARNTITTAAGITATRVLNLYGTTLRDTW